MNRSLGLVLTLALGACAVETGGPRPAPKGRISVDSAAQEILLDTAKVPVLSACASRQVIRRAADGSGWECIDLPAQLNDLPGRVAALESALTAAQAATASLASQLADAQSAAALTVTALDARLYDEEQESTALRAALNDARSDLQSQLDLADGRISDADALFAEVGGGAVGDVVASLLGETEFQTIRGTNWILADGRSDIAGTGYEALCACSQVPDLRGVFLRGRNNGRSVSTGNPDGELAAGAYQADDNKNHAHTATADAKHPGVPGFGTNGQAFTVYANSPFQEYQWYRDTQPHSHTITVNTSGGSESRPRSVTVNFYIRVD